MPLLFASFALSKALARAFDAVSGRLDFGFQVAAATLVRMCPCALNEDLCAMLPAAHPNSSRLLEALDGEGADRLGDAADRHRGQLVHHKARIERLPYRFTHDDVHVVDPREVLDA